MLCPQRPAMEFAMPPAILSRISIRAVVGALLLAPLLALPPAVAQDRDSVRDPARYVAALRQRDLISPILQSQVEGIARVLANEGAWPRVQVNGDYDRDAVNIYLVDTRSGAAPMLTSRLRGTFLAFPPQRLILGDAQYLAEVKAAADIYWHAVSLRDGSVKTYDALLIAKVEGPDNAVHSRLGPYADWRAGSNELADGAIAFLLAHEMGHLAIGIDPKLEDPIRLPHGLTGPDRDRFWACANLVGPQVAGTREQEAEADAYAARLLARLPAATSPRRLRYEHGTLFLRNAEIGMVVAGLVTTWPRGQMLLDRAALPIDRDAVRAYGATLERDAGMIETVFPSSHPAQVNRMFGVYEVFANTPQSAYYGDSDQHDAQMWQVLIQLMCSGIQPGR